MGNREVVGTGTRQGVGLQPIDSYFQSGQVLYGKFEFGQIIGNGKLLKTVQAVSTQARLSALPGVRQMVGNVVIKIYIKRDEFSLESVHKRMNKLHSDYDLVSHPGLIFYRTWADDNDIAYWVRQFFANNLFDRFYTQPFLTEIEKRWMAFQLLKAVEQLHSKDNYHGDIKCENIMCTSWNWLLLTDFAFYKPTYLPVDNPSDSTFYFDTGSGKRCYVVCKNYCIYLHPHDHRNSCCRLPSASTIANRKALRACAAS